MFSVAVTYNEDAFILQVIEAYCNSTKTRHTVNSCEYAGHVTAFASLPVGSVDTSFKYLGQKVDCVCVCVCVCMCVYVCVYVW